MGQFDSRDHVFGGCEGLIDARLKAVTVVRAGGRAAGDIEVTIAEYDPSPCGRRA
jgi:hypothetical protein